MIALNIDKLSKCIAYCVSKLSLRAIIFLELEQFSTQKAVSCLICSFIINIDILIFLHIEGITG